MRIPAAFALVLLASLALAGCSGNDPLRYPSPVTSTSHTATSASASASSTAPASSSSSSTGPAGNATGNHPPTGALDVQVNGTLANFTLTGSDADNDSLSWTLAFGDGNATNGTALPATVTHNYTAAGNVTPVFTLSDGNHTTAYNATIAVGVGAAAETVTSTWTVGSVWCVNYPYNASSIGGGGPTPFKHGTPAANSLYGEVVVKASWAGRPYHADFGKPANMEDAAIIAFYDASDGYLDSGASAGGLNGPPDPAADPMTADGTIPAGAAIATLMNCANPQGITATLTVG